jgi:hypothetical protein
MRKTALLLCLMTVASCGGGGSPTEPSPGGGVPSELRGQTVNAIDGAPVSNLSVKVGTKFPVSTDSNGYFQVDVGDPATHRVVIGGSNIVERDTRVSGPTANRTRLSVIPTSFDLAAFDQMFRTTNGQLQRWTSRPSLVILAAVMEYRNSTSGQTFDATDEQLTEEEIAVLRAQLTEGLALLTGNTYPSFSSVEIERPAGGARVNTLRAGQIVVGRYNGIQRFAQTIGYGLWSERPDGSIAGGSMYLDRGFDRDDSRRKLLRIHELGHALGYQHVEARTSIMNPSVGPEPTDFDRAGAIIAFERPVGNKSPDTDPTSSVLSASTGEGRWMRPATPCALAR